MAAVASVFGSDDLLREILHRLNSPTCLVRSAAVSKRWLRHASDRAFLHRFRARHPPSPLGFYLVESGRPSVLFEPTRRPPALAPSVRGGGGGLGLGHRLLIDVSDCRNGRLLATVSHPCTYAVGHPLNPARGITAFPKPRIREVPMPEDGGDAMSLHNPSFFHSRQLLLLGDGTSCIAVTLMRDRNHRRVWVHLQTLQLETGFWGETTTSDPIELPQPLLGNVQFLRRKFGALNDGKLYMHCTSRYILGLDLAPTSLFYVKLPEGLMFEYVANTALSNAEGGGFCLVHVKRLQISVWRYSMDSSNTGSWNLVHTMCMRQKFGHISGSIWHSFDDVIYVAAVGDNAEFVYLLVRDEIFYMYIGSRTVEKVYKLLQQHGIMFALYPLMAVWPPTPSQC
ncbi:unnamed protein product [Urochloa decumbens]|uniref:F-box protein AT5G49610-like beta-propeller domain-containing protein n=1 Tax=Urochloa decumbens TaxID=240449 RepID=A0ABC9A0R3_9POAL